ncbi:7133_t:CDS:2 [Entrophospora sp. SA101]|nr:7133_t:CDS:2 [Entrophospora sp. SA101]
MDTSKEHKMMASSDYSFLERSVHEVYIWIWFIIHVYRCDKFSSLQWKRIRALELKSFVTILILLTLPFEAFYDIILTKIKYTEGFYLFVPTYSIRSKPRWLWSEEDQSWWTPTFYTLMVGFSFQTGTLFLLQCFWNYLSNSIAKVSFMSRIEFSIYVIWGVISVIMFPILPAILSEYESLIEVVPQLAYASQLMILAILGIITHSRFQKLINTVNINNKNKAHIIAKIRYFIDMNKLLTGSLFIMSASFFILTIDTFIDSRPINSSKLASDVLIAHVNFAAVIEWVILILIFYPRKGFVGTGSGGSSFNTNLGSAATNSAKLSNMPPVLDMEILITKQPSSSLKRNVSISKDGKVIYTETKPLGKVGGLEFVAVEKADPRSIPSYYFMNDNPVNNDDNEYPLPNNNVVNNGNYIGSSSSGDENRVIKKSSDNEEPEPRKSTQQERMLVLQRQRDEFNSSTMPKNNLSSMKNQFEVQNTTYTGKSGTSKINEDAAVNTASSVNLNRNGNFFNYRKVIMQEIFDEKFSYRVDIGFW